MPPQLEHIKVQALMETGERKWDEEILQDIMNDRDRELIKKIPLPLTDRKDSWFWIFDEKGMFTVKSCYRKVIGEYNVPHSAFWRKLWAIKLPSKIVNFVWRTCSACLPTTTRLISKQVNVDAKCPWCVTCNEDEIHVLFDCVFARSVWTAAGMNAVIQIMPGDNVFDVLSRICSTCTTEQVAMAALYCWSIWNRRNKWVWERINVSVFGVKSAALNLLGDWKKAHQESSRYKPTVTSSTRHWSAPPQGWVKINIDAALFTEENCVGLGGVIRDSDGRFLRARCKRLNGLLQPREVEALSLKEALSWTQRVGFKNYIFETDAKLLADACNGGQGRSYFHTIVEDCVEYFKHFDHVLVQYVHRSANGVAHLLARASHSLSDSREWVHNAPEFVYDAMNFDKFQVMQVR